MNTPADGSARPRIAGRLLRSGWAWLLLAMAITAVIYTPGLSGGFLFDDYPNIVDNSAVHIRHADLASWARVALSSPASEFKRPLASLSFAANFLAAGLSPYWMKLTNLAIHLLNGWLVFLLARRLVATQPRHAGSAGWMAAVMAGCWLVLPINLTGVLYVVQRMESMANLFVLAGLIGYLHGRRLMLDRDPRAETRGLLWCVASLAVPAAIGVLAKETAVMLPLYGFLIEWILFGFRRPSGRTDGRLAALYVAVLALPAVAGLAWLLPGLLQPEAWATRDFTLGTRLLSEARIVTEYVGWVLVPFPGELSFYHDNFHPSTGLFHPWTTAAGVLALLLLLVIAVAMRRRFPLVSLGVAFYLGCHLLTGTILPLELVYEHRNYFASFGLLLAVVPPLATGWPTSEMTTSSRALRGAVTAAGRLLLGGLAIWWIVLTALTAHAWGDTLRLARELAARAPDSPRAQYELGRTYIIASHYDRNSPYTQMAYAPLERAARLPDSSILPQQALIFMNSRMGLPIRGAWWDSMVASLKARRPGVQDESSLAALAQCARERACPLPADRMTAAFEAALSHRPPSARLLATYGNYAWNVLDEQMLGISLLKQAAQADPAEPAYHITLARMHLALRQPEAARTQVDALRGLDTGGRLDEQIDSLLRQIGDATAGTTTVP